MFDSLLIANRGEIACRIMRSARAMGLRCVAVYSDVDADAQHVLQSDLALRLGPAPAAESYLRIDAILEAAKRAGAQAIHPGYGFLSENAGFAEACAQEGLIFVGPPAAAIRAMGSKSEAKAIMAKAGVPLVPGYHGTDQDPERLAQEAAEIGYPVLIKASAGGGGKGMRPVRAPEDFSAELAAAKREAKAAFGDDRVLIEKYLGAPRHIEVQVLADSHGKTLHLFERDCSLQRRHQKVIEEAPAPGLTEAERDRLCAAGVAAAEAVGYVGAGTVEFIAEDGAFYFMEMNTRLQVEHPVTEMITGLDLVAWQLRIAAGEALPFEQSEISVSGHAVEARVYAEDPANDFLPTTGRLTSLSLPDDRPGLRVDSGVVEGDEITPYYDPMIAKVIAQGADRAQAVARLAAALADSRLTGLNGNIAYLEAALRHPDFRAGQVDTGFLARHADSLLAETGPGRAERLALSALAEQLLRARQAAESAALTEDPYSPWADARGWRLNGGTRRLIRFRQGGETEEIELHYDRDGYAIRVGEQTIEATARDLGEGAVLAGLDGVQHRVHVVWDGARLTLSGFGWSQRLELVDPLGGHGEDSGGAGHLSAPMPGRVTQVAVSLGEAVEPGQLLLVLEAMKMEHSIKAPMAGIVAALQVVEGDQVEEGVELVAIEAEEGAAVAGEAP